MSIKITHTSAKKILTKPLESNVATTYTTIILLAINH